MIFLSGWTGESAEALFALEHTHRVDSLVLAFEQALQAKAERGSALTEVEDDVLAIESLERDVNNGGYSQFLLNSSGEVISRIVPALHRIGCPTTAEITARAVAALGLRDDEPMDDIGTLFRVENDHRDATLAACTSEYFDAGEDIAGRLFAYLKQHRGGVTLP